MLIFVTMLGQFVLQIGPCAQTTTCQIIVVDPDAESLMMLTLLFIGSFLRSILLQAFVDYSSCQFPPFQSIRVVLACNLLPTEMLDCDSRWWMKLSIWKVVVLAIAVVAFHSLHQRYLTSVLVFRPLWPYKSLLFTFPRGRSCAFPLVYLWR